MTRYARGRRWSARLGLLVTLSGTAATGLTAVPVAAVGTGTTERASVAGDGNQGNQASDQGALSPDGRYLAFRSVASNLVSGDTNGAADVFVRDNLTGSLSRVSVASDGTQASDDSRFPALSADGRFVAFESEAPNLAPGDSGSSTDAFLHDRQTGATSPVAGRLNGGIGPALSADGRFVAFASRSADLVAGDTNSASDVFVHETQTGVTSLVSVSSDLPVQQGTQDSGAPAISADGRYVSFESFSPNLVVGDVNRTSDIFVHDRQTATTTRASVFADPAGAARGGSEADISADGQVVAFTSVVDSLRQVFVRDLDQPAAATVSVAPGGAPGAGESWEPTVSADGGHVAFVSRAADLVAGDANNDEDVFVRDLQAGTTRRASVATDGTEAERLAGLPRVSGPDVSTDGRYTSFADQASNLVVGDTNAVYDVFVRDRDGEPGEPEPDPALVGAGDVRVYEGDAGLRGMVFKVTLSAPAASTVTVDYATRDGSATAPADYTARAGTLSFAPGVVEQKVKVKVSGDLDNEVNTGISDRNESFWLDLSRVSGPAVIADFEAQGKIAEDDPPEITGRRVTIGDAAVHEGDVGTRAAVFTVSLSTPSDQPISVDYATADGTTGVAAVKPDDYLGARGTLRFAPGATSLTVAVTVRPDTVAGEGQHRFSVVLSNLRGAGTTITDDVGQGTILDDD